MYWVQGTGSVTWRILTLSPTIGPAFNLVVDVDREPNVEITGWIWPVLPDCYIQLSCIF
jgi:hypothetical protein